MMHHRVDVGWDCVAAVDGKGQLFVWGDDALLPEAEQRIRDRPVLAMNGVKEVALGNERAAVILSDGSLWG